MLAEKIKNLRNMRRLTQAEFARLMGVSTSAVSMWETEQREPDLGTIGKIADFFNVSVDYLMGRDAQESGADPLDEQLKDIAFALYGEMSDLSDEAKKDIIDFYNFKKAQEKKKGK